MARRLQGGQADCGVVFELTQPGGVWTEKILYSFTGGNDSAFPRGRLIADKNGTLYSVTGGGGASAFGTIFQLTPPATAGGSWTETVLHSFSGGSEGRDPETGLIFDWTGALYDTTFSGRTANPGTVFKLTH